MTSQKTRAYYDRLGIFTSITCAIHCTLLPIFVSSLTLGFDFLSKGLEWVMMSAALIFGTLSFRHGYKRHHRRALPTVLFIIGYFFLLANLIIVNHFIHVFILMASFCIVIAHLMNVYHCSNEGECDQYRSGPRSRLQSDL